MILRKANSADQATIKHIVRSAQLAPFDLDWHRFVVAEEDSQIVGVAQVRQHRDGSHELASLAIIPEYQGQGIGSALTSELLKGEIGVVYLFCRPALRGYYVKFGFQQIPPAELPLTMRRIHRFARLLASLGSALSGHEIQIMGMRRCNPDRL